MKKNIDWIGFKENVETYIRKHRGISGKMLKQLFDNYSENAVKNCTIPHVSNPVCPICWQPLEGGIVKNMCVNDECLSKSGQACY